MMSSMSENKMIQSYICPRDYRLLGSWGAPWIPSDYRIARFKAGPFIWVPLCRETLVFRTDDVSFYSIGLNENNIIFCMSENNRIQTLKVKPRQIKPYWIEYYLLKPVFRYFRIAIPYWKQGNIQDTTY